MVQDLERLAVRQGVPGLGAGYRDPQPPSADEQGEREPGKALGEPRREADGPVPVAQAAETADQGAPGPGQRGDVDSVTGAGLQAHQSLQGGLAEAVEGQD